MGKDKKPERGQIVKEIAIVFFILLFFYGVVSRAYLPFYYLLSFLALFSALMILKGIFDYLRTGDHTTFIGGLALMALLIFFGGDLLVIGWIDKIVQFAKSIITGLPHFLRTF